MRLVLGSLYWRNFIVPVWTKSEFSLQLYKIVKNNKCTSVLNVILLTFRPIMKPVLEWYWLTPWSRVLLEKLIGYQLAKRFPAFYGTQRFINTFTSARYLSLSRARLIQFIPHPISWRSILILSYHLHLGLPSGIFPSGFSTKTLNKPPLSPINVTCPAHLIILDFIIRKILGVE
jgi:hypothetical protein